MPPMTVIKFKAGKNVRKTDSNVVRVKTSNYAPQLVPLKLKEVDVWRKPHARNHVAEFGAAEMGQDCREDGLS